MTVTHALRATSIALVLVTAPAGSPSAAPRRGAPRATAAPEAKEESLRHYLYGRWLELDGQFDQASEEYFRALSLDPRSVDLLVTLASLQARMGESQRSLELATQAARLDSTSARAHWLRGAALLTQREVTAALPPLQTAARLDSTDIPIMRTLARAAELADDLPQVEAAYRRLTRLDDEDGEAWFQLATAEARASRYGAADTALSRSLELQPARPGAHFLGAWIHENLGRPDDAIADYRAHLEEHPEDLDSRRRLVMLLGRAGRAREAWPDARVLAHAQPDDPDALLLAAQVAYEAGRPAEGQQLLARFRASDPADPGRVERSVFVLARTKRAAEGVKLADAWAAEHPGDLRGTLLTARARALANDLGGAAARARAAIAAAPDSIAPRVLLARILEDAARWPDAARAWAEVVARAPADVPATLQYAHALDEQGAPDSAAAVVRSLITRDPDNATALNFLGYLWADRDRNLDEAEAVLRQAIALEPDNGAFVDSWGWLLYRRGRFEEARTQLERALVLTGGDPVIHEHLGDVYAALREPGKAREQYQRSLDRGGDKTRVRNKLSGLR